MQTADDVRALARRYARTPTVQIVRLPVKRLAPRFVPAPVPVPVPPPIPRHARLTTHDIIRTVAWAYGIHADDITGPSRVAGIVLPRQVAMYLARDVLKRSLSEIGRRFGGRDHTTALSSIRKIAGFLQTDEALASDISALKLALGVG